MINNVAPVAESVDAADSKSVVHKTWEFESPRGHQIHSEKKMKSFDAVIIGGGLVGAFAAIGLSQNGLTVALIDNQSADAYLNLKIDGRTTAVAQGIMQTMDTYGVGEYIRQNAQPIDSIKVFEDDSPWQVNFDHGDVGPDPLGYIVENYYIRDALFQRIEALNIETFYKTTVTDIQKTSANVTVTLHDGQLLKAPLIISAEGRHSPSRAKADIKTTSWDYGHMAFVAHITHEKPHNNTAYEMFMPSGPLAVLPMGDTEDGLHRAGLVWCDKLSTDWMSFSLKTLESNFLNKFPYLGGVQFYEDKR
jgi:2-octaprenyl-6-methoxyphenol hydroxylase